MLSAQVFDLYQPLNNDDSIVRVESRTYLPFVKSFGNNDIIEISINRPDTWLLMHDAAIIVQGKLTKTAGAGTVGLINNAGAYLFDTISYELNGTEIDIVRDPGVVSTIRGFLCYEKLQSQELCIAGWNYPDSAIVNEDETFNLRIPLKHILNFFNDYRLAICGKQNLRLVRARNDFNAMIITAAEDELPGVTQASISISNIELRVRHITPNDVLKVELLQSIKADKPLLMPFRRWELHELPSLTQGSPKQIWNVKTSSVIECPRYVICCFHHNRKNMATRDPNNFDNLNVSNVRLLLNGEYYPQEQWNLNFRRNDYAEAHFNYSEFSSSYLNQKKLPLLDYVDFAGKTLFVIDCSRRDETFKSSTVDIKIEIECRDGFPMNTRAYCVIIHDVVFEYRPLSEIIRKLM